MFREELRVAVAEELGIDEKRIEVRDVKKNNGMVKVALIIREEDQECCPNVYIDEIIGKWQGGMLSFDEAVKETAKVYRLITDQVLPDVPEISREMILNSSFIQVVNADKNREELEELPHRECQTMPKSLHSCRTW